jgi:hypothetical protein
LLLPAVAKVSAIYFENIQLAKMFGQQSLDPLLAEIFLQQENSASVLNTEGIQQMGGSGSNDNMVNNHQQQQHNGQLSSLIMPNSCTTTTTGSPTNSGPISTNSSTNDSCDHHSRQQQHEQLFIAQLMNQQQQHHHRRQQQHFGGVENGHQLLSGMEHLLLAPIFPASQQSNELSSPEQFAGNSSQQGHFGSIIDKNAATSSVDSSTYLVNNPMTTATTTILDRGQAWQPHQSNQQHQAFGSGDTIDIGNNNVSDVIGTNQINHQKLRNFSGAAQIATTCTPPLSAPSSATTMGGGAFYPTTTVQKQQHFGGEQPQHQLQQQQYFFVNTPPPTNTAPCSAGPYGAVFKY